MRKLLPFLLASLALASAPSPAQVEPYPSKAVKFIVPVPPGGAADVMARMVAEQLQNKLGQPFVVDNRPGAGSAIGMQALAKSPPDGYTIGLGNIAANAINPAVQPDNKLYDPVNDFAPVSLVGITPLVLVVNAEKVPSKTLEEFIAYLKANPNKLSYGSSGNGSSLHLGMELFLLKTGTKMTHVPYKGSAPMVTDLISGQVDASMDAATSSWPHVQSGKLRAIALTGTTRSPLLPQLPTVAEAGLPGFDVTSWYGVFGPAMLPKEIVARLNSEIGAAITAPELTERLNALGAEPAVKTPAAFAQYVRDEIVKWAKIVKESGAKLD